MKNILEMLQSVNGQSVPSRSHIVFSIPQVVRTLQNIVGQIGNTKTGTYDQADPTAFANCSAWVEFEYDPFGSGEESQWPANYLVELNDCTWGITINISNGDSSTANVAKWYLDNSTGDFLTQGAPGHSMATILGFLVQCLTEGKFNKKQREIQHAEEDYHYA